MSVRKKLIVNTLAQVIYRLSVSGSAFLVSLLIARYFGARGFGEYSKATTYISLFYLLTDFGLNAVILRKIAHEKENEQKIISSLFGLRLIISLGLVAVALLITPFLPHQSLINEGFTPVAKQIIMVLSVLIIYTAFSNSANLVFQKTLRYDLNSIAGFAGSLVIILTTYFFIAVLKLSLPLSLLGYVIGAGVIALLMYLFIKKLKISIAPLFIFSDAKTYLIQALPLGLTLIFNLVYFRADIFILTLTRSTSEVGNYALAYKFFEFAITLPSFFANSLYPVLLTRLNDKKEFVKTIYKAGILLFVSSLGVLVFFFLGAPLLQYIRSDFYPSIQTLKILSLSMPFFFLSSLFMWILITFGKNWQLLKIYLIGMILNIILNLIFIPTYGTSAAAIITLVSELFIMLVNGLAAVRVIRDIV